MVALMANIDVAVGLKAYEHKEALLYPQVLEAVILLLEPVHPTHFRLEALRAIGFLEDPAL
jgi:hypothetical protein